MNLNKLQLDEIKAFISKKGIKYLDVQMEILDHVATAVEEKMSGNQDLTFTEALRQIHASFGIFGFSGVEEGIISGMNKKYRGVFWNNFLTFFTLSYLPLVFFAGFLLYQIQIFLKNNFSFIAILLIGTIGLIGILVVIGLRFNGLKNVLAYRTSVIYLIFIYSFLQIFNFLINNTSNALIWGLNTHFILVAILFVLLIIYIISALRTAIIGVKESKILMAKYQQIDY